MAADGAFGLVFVAAATLLLAVLIGQTPLRPVVKRLLLAGLALRVCGALLYLYLVGAVYGGGDYLLYYGDGLEYAAGVRAWGFSDSVQWWGTPLTIQVTGALLLLIGPTLPGAFIVFAVVGYGGLVALVLAFHRAWPDLEIDRYLGWVALFPSLWFWPAALGKDAIVLLGVGIATLGFVGRRSQPGWIALVCGIAIVFAIRPQVAAVLSLAMAAAYWMATFRTPGFWRMVQGTALVAAGALVVTLASGQLGVDLFDPGEVGAYAEGSGHASAYGGSAIGGTEDGTSIFLAPVNVLMRPFPWEARGPMELLAAAEILVLWVALLWRRRAIATFVRERRRAPLFWLGILFILSYALALGVSAGNVGIIARQRVHILPFALMFIAAQGVRRPGAGAIEGADVPRASSAVRLPATAGSPAART